MHPLLRQLEQVRLHARRLVIWRAASYALAATLISGLTFASVDAVLRIDDQGTRWLLTVGWGICSVAACWYWLIPVWRTDIDLTSVARLLERHFPELQHRLSSTVEFLAGQDAEPAYGSAALMHRLISQTAADVGTLDLDRALDPTPRRRSFTALACATVVGVLLAVANPQLAGLSLHRLMTPWKSLPWPQRNHLVFVDMPQRVTKGADLRFVVKDATGRTPARVDLELADTESDQLAEQWSMRQEDGRFVFEREKLTRSFRYRATGGDDTAMPWREIEVVEAPQITSVQISIRPPAYTGWLPETKSGMPTALRVLAGSEIYLRGQANRLLLGADLSFHVDGKVRTFHVSATSPKRDFTVPTEPEVWAPTASGEYRLKLMGADDTSTVQEEAWAVRVVPDQPPTVTWDDALTENWVTPNATLPLHLHVEDDIGIHRIALHYVASDPSVVGDTQVTLYRGPDQQPTRPMPDDARVPPDRQMLAHTWSLEALQLSVGCELAVHVTAEDYLGQRGQSQTRQLAVISPQELVDRVARRHAAILSRLRQRLDQQRRVVEQMETVKWNVAETGEIASSMDHLQSAVLNQRQVNSTIADADSAMRRELAGLQSVLRRSQVVGSTTEQSVSKTLESLEDLADTHLVPGMDLMLQAQQAFQASLDLRQAAVPSESPPVIAASIQHLQASQTALEGLLDEMSSWDNVRRISQDLQGLLRQQVTIQQETQTLAGEVLSHPVDSLRGELRATMRSLATRQRDLGRRTERLLEHLPQLRERLETRDPDAEQRLRSAMQGANDLAVTGRMRQAGKWIAEARMGAAAADQAAAAEGIEEMLRQLSRQTSSADERRQQLRDSRDQEQRVAEMRSQLLHHVETCLREQEAIYTEIQRLDGLRNAPEQSRAALRELVAAAAEREDDLCSETNEAAAAVESLPAYASAMQEVAVSMSDVTALLRQEQTASPTQVFTESIMNELKTILATLASEPNAGTSPTEAASAGGSPPQGGGKEKKSPYTIVQLKLLRAIQAKIHQDTQRLHERRQTLQDGDDRTQRYIDERMQRLAVRQGQLADAVARLLLERESGAESSDSNERE